MVEQGKDLWHVHLKVHVSSLQQCVLVNEHCGQSTSPKKGHCYNSHIIFGV